MNSLIPNKAILRASLLWLVFSSDLRYTGILFELPLSGYPRYTVHRKLVFLNGTKKPFTRFRYNQVSIVWHVYLIECLPVRLKEGFDYQRRKRWLWKHDIVYRGSCVVWLLVLAFPCPTANDWAKGKGLAGSEKESQGLPLKLKLDLAFYHWLLQTPIWKRKLLIKVYRLSDNNLPQRTDMGH